ncbi:ATP synthase F1, delta subunit [Enterococcus sp. 8G7_MSG3316]|uniref:ATP synthase subunit delta n=1 Tax=Candidatus Enterococcus testudinis TaxID=1834191 RepID=A0A242A8F3_9ENTE|nr:ATP synthase F1 subunit delta [Enterococcus sp. 8G7_MSG3316]OTN77315.1 ATP synthase F1, delta subunit [Enterococcus sp. 8G7_MSG3316]
MKLDKFTVGKRYGKALFELAIDEQRLTEVYQELLTLRQVYQALPEFGQIVTDNHLDIHEKRKLFDQLLKGFDGLVRNFLEIVYEYNRMDDLLLIIDEYERRYDEYQGLVLGTVTTAVALSAEQKSAIEQQIALKLGYKQAQLKTAVDPEILGGVIVEANHQVIDGSIKSQLDYLRQQMGR